MEISDILEALRGSGPARKSAVTFGDELGVSHTTVRQWTKGAPVSEWNRVKLLAYARAHNASAKVIRALESIQPKIDDGAART